MATQLGNDEEMRRMRTALTVLSAAAREGWIVIIHEDEECPEDDTCECPAAVKLNMVLNSNYLPFIEDVDLSSCDV